jgi:hypothetical protein
MTAIGYGLFHQLKSVVMDYAMADEIKKIERNELHELFGDTIPVEVIDMLWDEKNSHLTIGEMRVRIRKFAHRLPLQKTLEHCQAAHGHVVEALAIMQSRPVDERSAAVQTRISISVNELASAIARLKTMIKEVP